MANISKIKLPSGVTYDVVDEKSGYITSASLPTKTSDLTNDSGFITSYTDTKNTAGSTNSTSKLYLIGATSQAANPQTYSNSNLYFSDGLKSVASAGNGSIITRISQSYNSIQLSYTDDHTTPTFLINSSGINAKGNLNLYASNSASNYTKLVSSANTSDKTITFPDATGTVALTSDIPTVPTITLNGSSTTSPSFYAPTSVGTSGQYLKSNGSGAPSWTNFPTIPTKTSQLTNDSGFITSYTETDPTVPSWAKASTKPTYTASEVGALPDTTTIPTKTSQLTNDSGFVKTDTNTTYTLSNALSSHKFTHTLTAGGSGSGTSTATITFAAGSNVSLVDDTTNKKITISATNTKLQVAAITSGTTYYPIVGTGTTAATRQFDTTGFIYKGTNGTTSAIGHSLLTLGNATAIGTDNNKQGRLELYGTGAYSIMITPGAPTASRTITLPNATGTLALTSDLNNYLPLTGGSVTGPVTFNDSLTIDDATVGSLVVNGSASFTNNITVGGELTVGGSNVIATDISDKLTLGSAWTQLIKVVYELCGMVFYYVEAKPSSYNANYQYTMATFASGYRPSTNAVGQGYTTDGGFAPKSVVSVLVQTDGALKVNASNNTGAYFFASGWFKI